MRKFIFSIAALIISIAAFAQTEGENCANPSAISSLPYSAESQTTLGTNPYTLSTYTMRSGCHVYKYIPAENQNVTISLSGISRAYSPEVTYNLTPSNVGVFLFNGCPDAENAQLIGTPYVSNSLTALSGTINNVNLTASTEYYIVVAADSLISQGIFGYGAAQSYTTATFNISVEKVVEHDVAIRTVNVSNSGCSETTSVSYTIANNGTLDADSAAVSVVCNVNGVAATNEILPAIASGASLTRTFENVALAEGNNTIEIVATLAGDETPENNSGEATATRNALITDFAFTENFEGDEPFSWTASPANSWSIHQLEESDNHFYMTDTAVSKNSYIASPCLSFAELDMPELHFDVAADYPVSSGGIGDIFGIGGSVTTRGFVMGSINGTTWDTVAPIEATGVPVNKNISLARYANESSVQLRIIYNAGAGFDLGGLFGGTTTGGAGVAIDNIVVRNAADKDLGVTAITGPASGCGLSNGHVSITIKNYGRVAQSSYVVKYSVDGGENWVEETVSTPIAVNATVDYTFNETLSLPTFGTYNIIAKTALVGDEDPTNDEAEGFVVSQGLYNDAIAIFDDEEFINDWYADGTYSSWAFGKTFVPNSDSIWTWATNPNGPVNPGEDSYLYTPCYNLTGMTNPIIKISLKYNLSSMDMGDTGDTGDMPFDPSSMFGIFGGSLSLQYTVNGGTSWINVVAGDGDLNEGWYTSNMMTSEISDPGWSGNTNGFVTVKTKLNFPSAANLSSVKFRFAFKTTSMNMGDDETGMGGLFGNIFGGMTGGNSIQGAAINNFVIYDCSPIPTAEFGYNLEFCTGSLIEFTNYSQNADSYAWNFGDGQGLDLSELTGDSGFDLGAFFGDGSTTSTEENPTMVYNTEGNYVVTLTATNECGTSIHQDTLEVLPCTKIDEVEAQTSIYPNPASQNITIANAENANVEIINALGQVVYSNENISSNHTIDISNLTNGTYFVKVNDTVSKVNIVR
ncbi:MAG: T9SS type A sorting domain-containing protein [Bacteroidales bacterium]|nr:T9SS type A sorting domain-containing protein [Bacteroidales bacterium]